MDILSKAFALEWGKVERVVAENVTNLEIKFSLFNKLLEGLDNII
jgi:hypothetical protein